MPPKQSNVSELRQDLVSGEWVVVATGRAKRPHAFARQEPEPTVPVAECLFEALIPNATVVYDRVGEPYRITTKSRQDLVDRWWVQAIPNKFPAFTPHGVCAVERTSGPYAWQDGVGFHEVVITRDHGRPMSKMTSAEAAVVLRAYRDRYLAMKDDGCVQYISIFHNHGRAAGASVAHPHSQIIAIPVIPPDIAHSLEGSEHYFRRTGHCAHCAVVAFEREGGQRIVYENGGFLVLCPFASRQAFELRMFPKRHHPRFETITDDELADAGDALRQALARLDRGLKDPPYNFFIHTSPTSDGVAGERYHWHLEILPKTAVWAGFEIGTGIEISSIAPETAAKFLREVRVPTVRG